MFHCGKNQSSQSTKKITATDVARHITALLALNKDSRYISGLHTLSHTDSPLNSSGWRKIDNNVFLQICLSIYIVSTHFLFFVSILILVILPFYLVFSFIIANELKHNKK